ncbi:MAG: helix-turn-helix domain-containing protein, partial [bacterium]
AQGAEDDRRRDASWPGRCRRTANARGRHSPGHLLKGTGKQRELLISLEQGLLLRVEAAAILLGIGRTTMYELIRRRDIPVVRIGRRTLVHRSDLERFAHARRAG